MCSRKNSSIIFKSIIFLFLLFSLILSIFSFFSFSHFLSFLQKDNSNNDIIFAFAGDAIPHYMIRNILDVKGKFSLTDAFYFLQYYLDADAAFFNLETTLSENPQPVKSFHFSVQPEFLKIILNSGFTHFTIANNHSLDYGEKGFIDTLKYIDKFKCTGYFDEDYSYIIFNIKNIKIGFLSFTMLSNYPVDKKYRLKPIYIENLSKDEKILNLIERLDKESDILIAGIHWGEEYRFEPTDLQEKTAQIIIDKGVDIVWGNHPHVIEPFEIYKNKLILYSCGNLISGQAYNSLSKEDTNYHPNYFYTRAIPIIKVILDESAKLKRIELIPFFQLNNYLKVKDLGKYFTTLLPTKLFLNENHLKGPFQS